jgi:hypothetical protein
LTALALRPTRLRLAPGRTITRLQRGLMWLVGAAGGIVVIEPAPYELVCTCARRTCRCCSCSSPTISAT